MTCYIFIVKMCFEKGEKYRILLELAETWIFS